MLSIPPKLARLYEARLAQQAVAVEQRPHYKKWLRYPSPSPAGEAMTGSPVPPVTPPQFSRRREGTAVPSPRLHTPPKAPSRQERKAVGFRMVIRRVPSR